MLVKLEAYHDGKFWCGRGIGADFFTKGKTLDELLRNVKEAASPHFEEVLEREETLNLLLISDADVRPGKGTEDSRPVGSDESPNRSRERDLT